MPIPIDAPEVLNREFLEVRAKLLELAASLDRLDRADGSVENDPRMAKIKQALAILAAKKPERAEQIQLLFSIPYEEGWHKEYLADRAK
ncbi:MAG: hypothetical protein HYS13_18775 [Planctomycetia bacterium]|nr:hypothetical protein [Planctomycetia bacterium]